MKLTNNGVTLDPSLDGITHINIYSKANTPLGRHLSFFQHFTMHIEGHGTFNSIEGYWYWLATGMQYDNLRFVSGFDAKRVGKLLLNSSFVHVDDFDTKIENAVMQRLQQDPNLLQAVKASSLPFTHYYVDDFGKAILAKTQICVSIYERIRLHLQNV